MDADCGDASMREPGHCHSHTVAGTVQPYWESKLKAFKRIW